MKMKRNDFSNISLILGFCGITFIYYITKNYLIACCVIIVFEFIMLYIINKLFPNDDQKM